MASAEGVIEQRGRAPSLRPPRALKRALHALLVVTLVAAALALAAVVVPRALGYGTLAVLSGSMGKAAPTGSLVIGSWHAAGSIEVGDAILVRREGKAPVLHRVISRELESGRAVVRLKGDANPSPDPEPYTLPDRVLRKDWAIPVVGYAVGVLRAPAGWVLLVGLPTLLLALSVLRDVWHRPAAAEIAMPEVAADDDPPPRDLADGLAAHDRRLRDRQLELSALEASLSAREAALDHREASLRKRELELEAREAAAVEAVAPPAPEPEPELPEAHTLFVPGPKGYAFVERETGPPAVDDVVTEDGADYRVTRVGRSPLPGDTRPCAYLQLL